MPITRSSRELAQRVELEFHKRRNRFRYGTWIAGVILGLACVAWLALAGVRGQQTLYEPGKLSTAHQMLENNCAACHDKWAALGRLTSLNEDVRSVPNDKCLVCHDGGPHQPQQIPAHTELKCSACHGEHRGNDIQLTLLANEHCTSCHSDLKNHGHTGAFAQRIDSFDGKSGASPHPEFALHRRQPAKGVTLAPPPRVEPASVDCLDSPTGPRPAALPQNPDAARIRFNHKVHLQPRYGGQGDQLRDLAPFRDAGRELLDCASCHRLDAAGQYMLPIHYEQHCAACHPLPFDVERHRGNSVPHESPCIVRGFLTERYTLDALKSQPENEEPAAHLFQPALPKRGLLSEESAQAVAGSVLAAEKRVLGAERALLGPEAKGGCRYCHDVTGQADDAGWSIQPTQIPERWYLNSRFRHHAHRMLDCNACHRDFSQSPAGTPVAQSEQTADVLIPPISVCLKCHSSQPPAAGFLESVKTFTGSRTNCIECHTYHKNDGYTRKGSLGLDIEPMKESS